MGKLFIGPDSRECGKCRIVKPYDQFSPRGPGLYKSTCKSCCASQMRQWAKDNAERHATTRHAWDLRNIYGISVEQHAEMLKKQDGKCAICGEDETTVHGASGTKFRLSVDHCHSTGRVRGLLCQRCNRAIGLLGDNIDLLLKAVDYLKRE